VASNLLVYYREGDPSQFVVPDDFVVKDCDPGRRRTFKIWEEGKAPEVVFEVTSRSSRREDEAYKPQIYARLGVREYFLYDPTADYLDPPLQGFRLEHGQYARIEADAGGALRSEQLDLALQLEHGDLAMWDGGSGQLLRTEAEAAEAEREAAEAARRAAEADRDVAEAARRAAEGEREAAEAEREAAEAARRAAEAEREAAEAARRAAEARAAELEAKLQRLRNELKRKLGDA
jgi:hypothetical protein